MAQEGACGFVNLRGTGNLRCIGNLKGTDNLNFWGWQEEWDKKELASFKEEIADKRKQMETMISRDIYKRDLDTQKNQNTVPTAQQRRNKLKGFEDFNLKAKARIWL